MQAEDLIPGGYAGTPRVIGVFKSGGTTGSPRRVVVLDDWVDREMTWQRAGYAAYGIPDGVNWLALAPTGPHMIGDYVGRLATLGGGIRFAIDLDPRWVKRLIRDGKPDQADAYVEHLVAQTAQLLRTQAIGVLATTPPILERLVRYEEIVDLYGNTMTLGASLERPGGEEDSCVFDAHSPFVTYSVVVPETRAPVAYGERGQVVTSHVSKSFLVPNNAERDEAMRIKPLANQAGDSVADVAPLTALTEAGLVTVGVY